MVTENDVQFMSEFEKHLYRIFIALRNYPTRTTTEETASDLATANVIEILLWARLRGMDGDLAQVSAEWHKAVLDEMMT